jgi:hypothetical protein
MRGVPVKSLVRSAACALGTVLAAPPLGAQGDVRAYVGQVFVHGVPYLESRRWTSDQDTTTLIQMLRDPGERAHWPRVVAVLGIVGDDQAFCPLIEFLNAHATSPTARDAASWVPLALGYLAHTKWKLATAPPEPAALALAILERGVDPAFWAQTWPPELTDPCPRAWRPLPAQAGSALRVLARRSVLGLTLSGHKEAVAALEELADDLQAQPEAGGLFADLLPALLATAQRIEQDGLAAYYGQ